MRVRPSLQPAFAWSLRLLAATVAVLALGPPPAGASSLTSSGQNNQPRNLQYSATEGNENRVTVSYSSAAGGTYTFTDSGETITSVAVSAPVTCVGEGTKTVICTGADVVEGVGAHLADLDDSVVVSSTGAGDFTNLNGGDDDDVITGAPNAGNSMVGDDASNGITGDGNDTFTGGSDYDEVQPGGGADDLGDGAGSGGDYDIVSYQGRLDAPLVLDPDGATGDDGADTDGDGDADEGDTIGDGFESVYGGERNDRITGNERGNILGGYGGDDVLHGGPGTASDALSGGAGTDTVTYAGRSEPLIVTLGGQGGADDPGIPGNWPDEADNLTSADNENLIGGSGPDQLNGDGQANDLQGGAGGDHLTGADGGDTLTGGAGVDELDGDEGADTLRARDGESDDLDCGGAADEAFTDLSDPVAPPGCELVFRSGDSDGDGAYDDTDADDDNDGVPDSSDPFPLDPTKPGGNTGGTGGNTGGNGGTGGNAGGAGGNTTLTPPTGLGITFAKQKLPTALSKGFTVRAGCVQGCLVKAQLIASGKLAKRLKLSKKAKATVVATGSALAPAAGKAAVKLKFTTKAKRALKKLRLIKLSLVGVPSNTAGSGTTAKRTVTLRR